MGGTTGNAPNDADTAVLADTESAPSPRVAAEPLQDRISRYAVLEELGRGGMGRVLRAYDPKLQREVALKEVRSHLLGDHGAKRMVTEARAMAKLSHPNVVSIYDVEDLARHHIVLVMEYVAGATLEGWLERGKPSASRILRLFVLAGRGLSAAHGAGLLHRDFKPANVLVSAAIVDGGEPTADAVKVTDFGIAKFDGAPSQDSGEEPFTVSDEALTADGDVVGTPRYMAPEQHGGATLTPAADQYAFCVALWEALTGAPPFPELSFREVADSKRRGPPPWPSDVRAPAGVVQAIVRGLAREPEERWPSMEALLDELSPQQSRRRWLIAGSAAAAAAIGALAWQAQGSESQVCRGASAQLAGVWDAPRREQVEQAIVGVGADYATGVASQTANALDAYAGQWTKSHHEACAATTIRGEQSASVMDLRMSCLQRAKSELDATVDVLADADANVVLRAYALVEGLPELSHCDDVETLQSDVPPPRPEDAEAVEAARRDLAASNSALLAARHARARASLDRARGRLDGVDYGPIRTELALLEARLLEKTGQIAAAEEGWRAAMHSASRHRQWQEVRDATIGLVRLVGGAAGRPEDALELWPLAEALAAGDPRSEAEVLNARGQIESWLERDEEAERWQRRALELQESELGPDHLDVARTCIDLGWSLVSQRRIDEARTYYQRARAIREATLGPEHPDAAETLNGIAMVLQSERRFDEAIAVMREQLDLHERALGPDHPHVASTRHNLGAALSTVGRLQEAESELRAAIDIHRRTRGPHDDGMAGSLRTLAVILRQQGRLDDSIEQYRQALAIQENATWVPPGAVAQTLSDLGAVVYRKGDFSGAEDLFRRAVERLAKEPDPDPAREGRFRLNLAQMMSEQGRLDEAWPEQARALELLERTSESDDPSLAMARGATADLLLRRGSAQEAVPVAEKAWACPRLHERPPADRAEIAFTLAKVLWTAQPQQRPRARELAEEALQGFLAGNPPPPGRVEETRTWLGTHSGAG